MSAVSTVQIANLPASGKASDTTGAATSRKAGVGASSVAFDLAMVGQSAGSPSAGDASGTTDAAPYAKFEAMVISQLVSTMLSSSGEGVFGEGNDMQAFSSVFAGAIGDAVVEHGGIGLAEAVARTRQGPSGQ